MIFVNVWKTARLQKVKDSGRHKSPITHTQNLNIIVYLESKQSNLTDSSLLSREAILEF